MTPLPSPEKLAQLVTNVTQTMFGIRFSSTTSPDEHPNLDWRFAELSILGARPITVGLSTDKQGCLGLSAAMFSCGKHSVDPSMIDDSLRELLNMTAGLVKHAMSLDQALGLPKLVEKPKADLLKPPFAQSVVVKATDLGLFLWVREGA